MTNSSLVFFKRNPQANLRLFCFPYAGGSSFIFRTWADSLPQNIELCAVELPGRGRLMKLPLITRMESLVKAIALIILPYLDKPFAFFGYSMGGLLSFELARHFRQHYKKEPDLLFIAARSAPQLPRLKPSIHELSDAKFKQELRLLRRC